MLFADYCLVHTAHVVWSDSKEPEGTVEYDGLEERRPFRASRLVDNSERFLFLYFPRQSQAKATEKFLKDRIDKGITLNKELFRFFGAVESGIKEGWAVFFKESSRYTVTRILKKCGDLEDIYLESGPGKYMARLALSFSSTRPTIDVPDKDVIVIKDIKAKDGTLTSDGCGIIRESYAKIIRDKLNEERKDTTEPQTAVFQFRRGGQKGILVSYPDRLFAKICGVSKNEYVYAYRPSMLKYNGGPTILEINNLSVTPDPARMNHAFVVLLLTLEVELQPIETLMKAHIHEIEIMSHDRRAALAVLKGDFDADGEGYFQDLFEMIQAGHSLDEPYVSNRIRHFQKSQYDRLRSKLDFRVEKSCYLFGVVDEQGVLKENEVYISLPRIAGVLEGKVLVSRNPAYLPSDMRVLKAVNAPELAFLQDCIVFPRSGRTSVPDLMAGGDLDGDRYFICYDESLIPSRKAMRKREALSEDIAKIVKGPKQISRSLSHLQNDVAKCFAQMLNCSVLGCASNEWKNIVGQNPKLGDGKYPKKLSEITAVALDMLKTGADYRKLVDYFEDLTDANDKYIDPSFDNPIEYLRTLVPVLQEPSKDPEGFTIDPALDLSKYEKSEAQWKTYYEEGKVKIKRFNRRLARVIQDHKRDDKFQRIGRPFQYRENEVDKFKKAYTERFFGAPDDPLDRSNYIRASAWYVVGYEQSKPAFAWLGARYLNQLKAQSTNGGKPALPIGVREKHRKHTAHHTSDESDASDDTAKVDPEDSSDEVYSGRRGKPRRRHEPTEMILIKSGRRSPSPVPSDDSVGNSLEDSSDEEGNTGRRGKLREKHKPEATRKTLIKPRKRSPSPALSWMSDEVDSRPENSENDSDGRSHRGFSGKIQRTSTKVPSESTLCNDSDSDTAAVVTKSSKSRDGKKLSTIAESVLPSIGSESSDGEDERRQLIRPSSKKEQKESESEAVACPRSRSFLCWLL